MLLLPCLLLSLSSLCGGQGDGKGTLLWQGATHVLDLNALELPEGIGPDAAVSIRKWLPRVAAADLELALTEDQVFLVGVEKDAGEAIETVQRASTSIRQLLPPRDRSSTSSGRIRIEHPDGSWEEYWDNTLEELGRGTGVLLEVREGDAYASILQALVEDNPDLGEWSRIAGQQYGFMIPRPLSAAWIAGGRLNEEWKAESELVHRTVALYLSREYGEVPFWLQLGICWHLETELCGGVWCYPYRDGFVWAVEHTDWSRALRNRMKRRRSEPFRLDEVTNLSRRVLVTTEADRPYQDAYLLAWGVARSLASNPTWSTRISDLLEAFRLHKIREGRRYLDDGRWELIAGYTIPASEQASIMTDLFGDDFWDALHESLEKGAPTRRE